MTVAAVVVTHNSGKTLKRCIDALKKQSCRPESLVLVDSGSEDRRYLDEYRYDDEIQFVATDNIGFARANNLGCRRLKKKPDFILFLNPDTFLSPLFIERAIETLHMQPQVGMLTGKMFGYDVEENSLTGLFDSTGIYQTWYGRWYDRGQGEPDTGQYDKKELVPAICGALMFCRMKALLQVALADNIFFDPEFFLYKEDIELSLRLRRYGWLLFYHPELEAVHCRGWQVQRQKMPLQLRKMAAANEVLIYRKHPSPYMCWALCKYFLVRMLHL